MNNSDGYMVSSPEKIKAKGWLVWPYSGHRKQTVKPKDLFNRIPDLTENDQMKRINDLKQQARMTFDLSEIEEVNAQKFNLPDVNHEYDDQIPF